MHSTKVPHGIAFTVKYGERVRALKTAIGISEAFDPERAVEGGELPTFQEFRGVWDTGATGSVVTNKVVTQLGLKSIDRTVNHTVGGTKATDVYLANVRLPNQVVIPVLRVVEGEIFEADVLIGMDVIGLGDFAVTNKSNDTWMTFCLPATRRLDFRSSAAKKKERANRRK